MSIELYYPNGINGPVFKIGTADFEYSEGSVSKFVGDSIRDIYRGLRLPINLLLGAINGNGASVPTYGLWGGPGWSSGIALN